jgi:hypothetical protein
MARKLSMDESANSSPGPLIIVNNDSVFAFDSVSGKVLAQASTRQDALAGFYEITSTSHMGPAVAYLHEMAKVDLDDAKKYLAQFKTDLANVQAFIKQNPGWVAALNQPAWQGKEAVITNLVAYACDKVSALLERNFPWSDDDFNNFFELEYNQVMIDTFILVAMAAVYSVYQAFHAALSKAQWDTARVVIQSLPGSIVNGYAQGNLGAGLDNFTNYFPVVLQGIAQTVSGEIPAANIIYAPYATMLNSQTASQGLNTTDLSYYKDTVWGQPYWRSVVVGKAFSFVQYPDDQFDLVKKYTLWPGDYDPSNPNGSVDDFMKRLKFSSVDSAQMQSSAVAWWVAPKLAAVGWDPKKVSLLGTYS